MSVNWKEVLRSLKDDTVTKSWEMNELTKNFFQGLFLLVPVVVTIFVVFKIFEFIDGWLNIPVPGLGFLLTVIIITVAGRLASNVFFQGVLISFEKVLTGTPFIKLVYTSLKDLIEAFMGSKKRFDQPVMVSLLPGGDAGAIGFITRQSLDMFGMEGHVAVYFPQSYNFAGHLLIFPRNQVRPLKAESSEVMAFIVSGGVSGGFNTEDNSESFRHEDPSSPT